MASLLSGLVSQPVIEVSLDNVSERKHSKIKDKDKVIRLPLFTTEDDISGTVEIKLNKSKKLEHNGIRIELVGHIDMLYDKAGSSDFMSMGRELEPAGVINEDKVYKFAFNKFEKQYESYYGTSVKLRYFLRAVILRNYQPKIIKELDFACQLPTPEPDGDQNIKMEVGIEDCLHIEFEYNKSKYHLKDVLVGKVHFLLVRIKIKFMEICIIKRESTTASNNTQTENETLMKYEVMDGCPTKGESIPIRLYLAAADLTPSYKNVNNKFSVKHFVNLVLVDEEDRRYFKQQEINIWRKK